MVVKHEISLETVAKMRAKAEKDVLAFRGVGLYGHNEVETALRGIMGEWAVRCKYREGGVQAHWNDKNTHPDISIPAHTLLDGEHDARCEEVKTWAHGYIWDNYGKTVRPRHAEKYERKDRDKIWFCSADTNTGTVFIHGWATPAEVLACEIIETTGAYGAPNHYVEDLHACSEVMPWVDEEQSIERWW